MLAGGGLSLPKLFVPSVKVGGDTAPALHGHCSQQILNTVMVQSVPVSSVMKIMMPLIMLSLSVHPWSPCRVSHQILHTAQHDTMVLLLILLYSYTNTPTLSTVTKCRSPQKHLRLSPPWLLSPYPPRAPAQVAGSHVAAAAATPDTGTQHRQVRQGGFYRGGGSDLQHDAAWGHDTTRGCVSGF